MNTAAINRQFLMGAVTSACPAICGYIHSIVPHDEVVLIGTLTEIFASELSLVPNVDTSNPLTVLNSNVDNVGIWLNNFCHYVLPVIARRFVSA